ncbi:restriction endonuclease subunit S [Shewanella putrefaciens]|uniref:restriction endonuclease subunit S n=1 Tax=Shewanella putrefaciens TaxID=24 RepID=UPI0018E8882D|nr:restriction endonuclease subunit S [Shewanella putrefaciens]
MRSRYQVEELGKHVHQVSSRNRSNVDIEVFSVTNSEGFTRSTEYFSKEVFSKDVSNYKVVKPNQFAYNPSRINVGSIDYLRHSSSVLVSPLYIVFECGNDIHADYLLRYLKSDWGNAQIRANTEGAVRDSLKYKGLENVKFPFAPINDQIRIAHLLGKVEGLIAQRKQHLQQLDDLLKSVFLEMFGFRDQTYAKWSVDKLAVYTEVVSGVTKGKKYKTDELIEVPYMRVANVQDGHFVLDEIKTISVTEKEFGQYQLRFGDLLLTEGGDPDKLGRGSVWENQIEKCIHQNHIFRVRINNFSELNSYYLSALIGSRYGKSYFLKSAKQTTGIASINSTQLKNFPTVIPPIELQNQFATIVEKVEVLKSRYQQSLNDLESLYGALSQNAFRGELDLSRVPLPDVQVDAEETNSLEQAEMPQTEGTAINLPDTDYLLEALTNTSLRDRLLCEWLESYCLQIGTAEFSTYRFLAAAQTRIAELHPDNEFELGASDYDIVKNWVFDALASDKLSQSMDEGNNRLRLAKGKSA